MHSGVALNKKEQASLVKLAPASLVRDTYLTTLLYRRVLHNKV